MMEDSTVDRSKEAAMRRGACVLEMAAVNRILTGNRRHDTPPVYIGRPMRAVAEAGHADTVELVLRRDPPHDVATTNR